jgi:hypothetical protein
MAALMTDGEPENVITMPAEKEAK